MHHRFRSLAAAAALIAASSVSALAQNNTCASATLITPGTYAGNTTSATNDGRASCVTSASRDVWYKIVPDADRYLMVDLCDTNTWDSVLSIHTACPGTAANAIACNDDSCDYRSSVAVAVHANTTYYIRIGGYNTLNYGAYTMHVAFGEPPPPPSNGPDVWVNRVYDVDYYATVGGISSYALGTDACNMGDAPAEWVQNTNRHPVIAQNIYRLKSGRFEQIGQSWLKHGFLSTNQNACGTCQTPPNGGAQLGVNCSDIYDAFLNGEQSNLGPRSQVNVTTGEFPYPYTAPGYSGDLMRRIQVLASDVAPAQNPGATYFGECQYVTQDDAQWNNGRNNMSHRGLSFAAPTAPVFTTSTIQRTPAIQQWQLADPSVTLTTMEYEEPNPLAGHGPITARFWLGSKVTDNGDGSYTYEYAVHNVNSHRSGGSFRLDLPAGAHLANIGFHDCDSHSGEPYSTDDWTADVTPFAITWHTQTYQQNQNANALRWATLYNFRFTCDVPPASGNPTLGLFRPGLPGAAEAVSSAAQVPNIHYCVGDFNHDGGFDGADVEVFFAAFEEGVPAADVNRDGGVDGSDVQAFFDAWENGRC